MASQTHAKQRWTGTSRRSREQVLTSVGRAGFTARGVVYVLVGYIALRIAFGEGGEADRRGALQQIAARPFGTALLWLLAAGFAGMAVWRAAQVGPRGDGGRKKGSRAMNAGRAVFYAFVCWGTAAYAAGSGGSGGSGGGSSDSSSKDWTANVLKLPAGRWLAGAAACALIAVGVVIAVRAAQRRFLRKLDTARMGRRVRPAVTASGVAGGVARGAVYAAAGVFVLLAAIRYDPNNAKGMDDTLRSFALTAAGPWLLVAVAAGLVLYGCFSFASARWRRL